MPKALKIKQKAFNAAVIVPQLPSYNFEFFESKLGYLNNHVHLISDNLASINVNIRMDNHGLCHISPCYGKKIPFNELLFVECSLVRLLIHPNNSKICLFISFQVNSKTHSFKIHETF